MTRPRTKPSGAGLRIVNVTVRPPARVSDADAAHHVQERLQVHVEAENTTDKPLHIWASRRAYTYDSGTKTLTVYLAEPDFALPPDIILISDHPRAPMQTVVSPGETATIEIPVPTTIRRRTPGEGLGMSFVEEAIDEVRSVELHVQYDDVPFQHVVGEDPSEQRARLRAHGRVVEATVTPAEEKE